MKAQRIIIPILVFLLLLSLGGAGWLWVDRTTVINTNATTQAEFGTLKDQITKADQVQDKNRQLQDQVDDLQNQLKERDLATPVAPLPEITPDAPAAPTDTPADPNAPTPTPATQGVPGSPAPTPGGVEPPADVLASMREIELEVIALRGLPEQRPVTKRFMTREELRAYIVAEMAKESTPDDYRHSAQEIWLLGFGPQGIDLEKLYIDLQTEQIAGFYDPEVDTFYLVGDTPDLPPIDQITYAHEFDHNLQDQTIDLKAGLDQGEYDADGAMAFRALIEGDATELMSRWLQEKLVTRMTPAELQQMLQDFNDQQSQASPTLDNAPTIIREGLLFPYTSGQAFVQALYQQGGWEAVTAALKDPPTSTEQIIHPEKYLAAERDEPTLPERFDLSAALGAGWTTATTSTLGEFDLRIMLRDTEAAGDTDVAAAGIGGIRYALYDNASQTPLLQMTARWDSPADGEEFLTAFRSTLQPVGDIFKRGDVFVAIKGGGQECTLLFSPDEAALRSGLAAQP